MSTSRRSILTGTCAALGAGAAANLAAIVSAKAAEPSANLRKVADPIFAAIERFWAAYDAVENQDDWDDDDLDEAVEGVNRLYDDLRFSTPSTPAGWAALLRVVVEREDDLGDCTEQLVTFCNRVAAAIERLAEVQS